MHGGDDTIARRLDGGFELHAFDHDQRVAARDGLTFGGVYRDDHTGHRRFYEIIGRAGSVAGVARHGVGVADRIGPAIEMNVDAIAVDRDGHVDPFLADVE